MQVHRLLAVVWEFSRLDVLWPSDYTVSTLGQLVSFCEITPVHQLSMPAYHRGIPHTHSNHNPTSQLSEMTHINEAPINVTSSRSATVCIITCINSPDCDFRCKTQESIDTSKFANKESTSAMSPLYLLVVLGATAAAIVSSADAAALNCTGRYQAVLQQALSIKQECGNMEYEDCCQV